MYQKINDVNCIEDVWEQDSYVKFKVINKKEIILEANRQGYLSLANLFRSIANNGINSAEGDSFDDSYWMYNFCDKIDRESCNIVLSYSYNKDENKPY